MAEHPDLYAHLQRLKDAASEDEKLATLAELARAVLPGNVPLESALRRLLEQMKTTPTAPPVQPAANWDTAALRGALAPSRNPSHLGRLGDYEVTGLLALGGMGAVLKGLTPDGRVVALKLLARYLLDDPRARQRFLHEVRNTIEHEHIVRIHHAELAGEVPFYVMDFVDGESLQQRVERGGALKWEDVVRLGTQTVSALEAAHQRRVIHRDVKPGNILLRRGAPMHVLVSDFGLALSARDTRCTSSGVTVGTFAYMAPEQADNREIDPRADLFSLGSVLYFACTGQPPFPGDTPGAVLHHICNKEPGPIEKLNPDIPPWLCAVIERLHRKAPRDRYGSASDVSAALRGPPQGAPQLPRGRILRPEQGAVVPREVPVEISLSDIPEGSYVWLAVEVHGQFWPKEPALLPGQQQWGGVIYEGGNPKDFTLSLWLVSRQGHRIIQDWFARAPRDGYPGLSAVPGGQLLHQVEGLNLI